MISIRDKISLFWNTTLFQLYTIFMNTLRRRKNLREEVFTCLLFTVLKYLNK